MMSRNVNHGGGVAGALSVGGAAANDPVDCPAGCADAAPVAHFPRGGSPESSLAHMRTEPNVSGSLRLYLNGDHFSQHADSLLYFGLAADHSCHSLNISQRGLASVRRRASPTAIHVSYESRRFVDSAARH